MESCSLCFNSVKDKNIQKISTDMMDILEVIFGSNTLRVTPGSAVCDECCKKILAAFNFKCTCINTEDFLVPFHDETEAAAINLRELYVMVGGNKKFVQIPDDYEICRLCLDIVNKDCISLSSEMCRELLRTFIPDLIVEDTLVPVACELCFKSLKEHVTFINDCLRFQNQTKAHPNGKISQNGVIKTESFETGVVTQTSKGVTKEISKTCSNAKKSPDLSPKHIENDNTVKLQLKASKFHNNDEIKHKSKESIMCRIDLRRLKFEIVNDKEEPETNENMDNECQYKTKHHSSSKKQILKPNSLTKENTSSSGKTDKLSLKTQSRKNDKSQCHSASKSTPRPEYVSGGKRGKTQKSIKYHKSTPEHASKESLHKCNSCPFQSTYEIKLQLHKLKHECSQGNDKASLQPSESELDIGSGHKSTKTQKCTSLSEIQIYKCGLCLYEAKHKGALDLHMLKHESTSEKHTYKNGKDDGKKVNEKTVESPKLNGTKLPDQLNGSKHKSTDETRKYRCEKCGYKTGDRNRLKIHKLKHE